MSSWRAFVAGALGPVTLACGGVQRAGSDGVASAEAGNAGSSVHRELQQRAAELRRVPLDIEGRDRLVLENFDGDVHVRASDRAAPELMAHLGALALEPSQGRRMLKRIEIVVERDGREVVLRLERPGPDQELFLTDSTYELAVPRGMNVSVSTRPGRIEILGPFRAARATTSYGSVRVTNVAGDVFVDNGAGNVSVEGIAGGSIDVDTHDGDIEILGVQGEHVHAHSGSGDVRLWSVVAEDVTLICSHGALAVEGLRGSLIARDTSGSVTLSDIEGGTVEVLAREADVVIRRATCALRIETNAGHVSLHDATGDVQVTSVHGNIHATGVFRSFDAVTKSGDVRVEARRGSVLEGTWHLESRYQDVELELPADLAFELQAHTLYGKIEPEFPLVVEAGRTSRENSLRGSINGGGTVVTLRSVIGSVRLLRGPRRPPR